MRKVDKLELRIGMVTSTSDRTCQVRIVELDDFSVTYLKIKSEMFPEEQGKTYGSPSGIFVAAYGYVEDLEDMKILISEAEHAGSL